MKFIKYTFLSALCIMLLGNCNSQKNNKKRQVQKIISKTQKTLNEAELFTKNCSACHSEKTKNGIPGVKDIRKQNYDSKWLYSFIKNSQALIETKDSLAIARFKKFNESYMPSFEYLGKEELNSLVLYLKEK